MSPQDFAYWLQGYSEVCGERPSQSQWVIIQDHLKEVFKKETPNRVAPPPPQDYPFYVIPPSRWDYVPHPPTIIC